jgi:16S rRNA processing protein RimM
VEPLLIPFVRAHLESVDATMKRIVMHLPEGLMLAEEE